jgi:outer membrane protein OmpA-like peptidoglycan-associated protein
MENFFGNASVSEENDWISFSDLMAGMMVIFLFIAIIYFDRVPKNTQQIIAQKIQLEKDLKLIIVETDELNKLKLKLELERKEIQTDLEQANALKIDLEKRAEELEAIVVRAEESRADAQEAADDAKAAKAKFTLTLDNFKNVELEIYEALLSEFEEDFSIWNAELIKQNLIFRFKSPEVLFPAGDSNLTEKFQKILTSFVPRYVSVLKKFNDYVEEVRVEGHTSSEFSTEATALGKYIANMNLSQDRTRSVTEFSLLSIAGSDRQWLQKSLTANGLSSSKLIYDSAQEEDRENSRRVEFTVRTAIRRTLLQLEKLNN